MFGADRLSTVQVFPYRKELKDPDQLYNTLKNLLAQIKVLGLWTRGMHPRGYPPGTGVPKA